MSGRAQDNQLVRYEGDRVKLTMKNGTELGFYSKRMTQRKRLSDNTLSPHPLCCPLVWQLRKKLFDTVINEEFEIRVKDDPNLRVFFETGDPKYFVKSLVRNRLSFINKPFATLQIDWLRNILICNEFDFLFLPIKYVHNQNLPITVKTLNGLCLKMNDYLMQVAERNASEAKKLLNSISPALIPKKKPGPSREFVDPDFLRYQSKKLSLELKKFILKRGPAKLQKGRIFYLNEHSLRLDLIDFFKNQGIDLARKIGQLIPKEERRRKGQIKRPKISDLVLLALAHKYHTTPQSLRKMLNKTYPQIIFERAGKIVSLYELL